MADMRSRYFFSLKPPFFHPNRLGARLLDAGIVTREQLRAALRRQAEQGRRLGYNLIALGYLDENTLSGFLSEQCRFPAVHLKPEAIEPRMMELLPMDFMSSSEIVPMARAGQTLTMAMVDPTDFSLIEALEKRLLLKINPVVAPESMIRSTLEFFGAPVELPAGLAGKSGEDFDMAKELFARLDDYEVVSVLGKGGFGRVYKCVQRSLERPVAIKVISKALANNPEILERFRLEGKITARLRHPHIVNVIDQGEVGDILYMAMEYVEGKTLDKYLRDKPLEKRIELFIQICQALDYAHAQGILHRDIKPANILVTHDETTKLLDFGIAQLRQSARESQLTQSNIVMGTPRYMAPEQMSDFHNIDGRADLYSVGVMMLEIFGETKDWPDASVNPRELNPEIPEPLAQAIQKCLARRPHERYASMADLGRFLCEFLERCKSGPIRQEAPLSEEEAQAALFRERFQIISSIRDDAQCSVALAEHKTLKRLILIKTCRNAANVNALKTLIKLRHPHVCEIFGMKEDGYKLSVVTEYLNGGTLGERMRAAGKIAADRAVGYLLPVAEALQFAHGYRIRHGHLHPDNVLIDENGAVKVTDFAMPSHCSGSMQRYSNANIADGYARDRFALGVMLFEMLTGEKYVAARGPQRNFALLENVKIQPANLKLALQKLWNIAPNQACYVDSKQLADELRAMADHLWRREQADSPGEQAAIPSKSLEAAHAATAPAEWPAGLIIGLAAAAALGLAGLLAVLAKLFG